MLSAKKKITEFFTDFWPGCLQPFFGGGEVCDSWASCPWHCQHRYRRVYPPLACQQVFRRTNIYIHMFMDILGVPQTSVKSQIFFSHRASADLPKTKRRCHFWPFSFIFLWFRQKKTCAQPWRARKSGNNPAHMAQVLFPYQ